MRALILAVALALAACATKPAEPVIRTVEVAIPTPVPCAGSLREPPAYPTKQELREAPGPDLRLQMAVAAYLLMDQWIREAAPVLRACR
jgi:hypothetical protein